ncbi:hypothetical protein CRG98_028655, partial [Punica granatum]
RYGQALAMLKTRLIQLRKVNARSKLDVNSLPILIGESRRCSNIAPPEASESDGPRLQRSSIKRTGTRAPQRKPVLQRQRIRDTRHEPANLPSWQANQTHKRCRGKQFVNRSGLCSSQLSLLICSVMTGRKEPEMAISFWQNGTLLFDARCDSNLVLLAQHTPRAAELSSCQRKWAARSVRSARSRQVSQNPHLPPSHSWPVGPPDICPCMGLACSVPAHAALCGSSSTGAGLTRT